MKNTAEMEMTDLKKLMKETRHSSQNFMSYQHSLLAINMEYIYPPYPLPAPEFGYFINPPSLFSILLVLPLNSTGFNLSHLLHPLHNHLTRFLRCNRATTHIGVQRLCPRSNCRWRVRNSSIIPMKRRRG